MYKSEFKTLLTTLMLAFTMSVAFSGCSSSEEESDTSSSSGGGECVGGGPRGDQGICCDIDPMQSGCPGVG